MTVKPLSKPRDGVPPLTGADDIDDAVAALAAGTGPFAVDTERAEGIRYSSRAYLVQVRREGAGTFLIDPVGIEHRLGGLREVMRDEWILHAADQDLPSLHELGLAPTKVFDTEIAALLLGFEHVSLKAVVEDELGWSLAKEYSNSDWSQRPLEEQLRIYAALDVELLIPLREVLTEQLKEAGRFEWFEQECEEVRLRKPNPPRKQPWRRTARSEGITDQRALAMLRELWRARDEVAKEADVHPERILPRKAVAQVAKHKPRSKADLMQSRALSTRKRRKYLGTWWQAIDIAWHLDERALPERTFHDQDQLFPPMPRWENARPEAAKRWSELRPAVLDLAESLGIRQEVLLKPAYQKRLAWEGWDSPDQMREKLTEFGARPWQVDLVAAKLDAIFAQ